MSHNIKEAKSISITDLPSEICSHIPVPPQRHPKQTDSNHLNSVFLGVPLRWNGYILEYVTAEKGELACRQVCKQMKGDIDDFVLRTRQKPTAV